MHQPRRQWTQEGGVSIEILKCCLCFSWCDPEEDVEGETETDTEKDLEEDTEEDTEEDAENDTGEDA